AEIVIEGFVSTESGGPGWEPGGDEPLGPGACFEGPFGDHTGFYSLPDRYPIVEVTAITHRRDAVFPATVVGLPPQEDYYLGKATERIFLPLLKTLVPDIEDYDLPMFGAFHNAAFLQIDKQYPLHARRVMHAIWGAGQMSWTKLVFVVDDVDPHDTKAVLRAVATRCDPEHDLELVRGPLDILDHAAPGLGVGWKLGFDATRRFEGERFSSVESIEATDEAVERCRWVRNVLGVSSPVPGWIFVRVHAEARRVANDLLDAVGARPAYVVLLGADVDIEDADAALFHWCANMDPGRDLVVRNGVAVFDATPKTGGTSINGLPVRHWPRVLPTPQQRASGGS
ncbi:MAG: UbiD family decarboxylase, partial [Phycisphaerales bacterium]|nr:UbiD family decarboxylase [Phycisphaerales bacterium]